MKNTGMKCQNRFEILEHLDHDVDFKKTWETIRKHIQILAKQVWLFWSKGAKAMIQQCIYKTIRAKETSQIPMVTGSEPNKCK
jgi:hypothetical protein